MKKVYVASSWRCELYPPVLQFIKDLGFDAYDFRNEESSFNWGMIDKNWQSWNEDQRREALGHELAERGFQSDMKALDECDILVLVLPCGRSAHLEAGYAKGKGKVVIVLDLEGFEPELMYKMVDNICLSLGDLRDAMELYKDQ